MTGNFSDSTPFTFKSRKCWKMTSCAACWRKRARPPARTSWPARTASTPPRRPKGINLLVDEGVLYKRRGIGMFVAKGGRQRIMQKRKDAFFETYVKRLVREARALGITREELAAMLEKAGGEKGGNDE